MARSNSHRLRIGRYSERQAFYLCTAKTISRARVFDDFGLGRIVVQTLRESDDDGFTDTWTFVIMPDHLHWLFQLVGDATLARVMGRVKSLSARRINEASRRSGRVWQAGIHDHCVRRDESLSLIARYVVNNPVRAGLVRSVRAYSLWDAKWL